MSKEMSPEEAKALLHRAIERDAKGEHHGLTADEFRSVADETGIAPEAVEEALAKHAQVRLGAGSTFSRPGDARSSLDKADGKLTLETPVGGWNEISSLPLLLGGCFLVVGVGGLVAGVPRGDQLWMVLGAVLSVVGTQVFRGGIAKALERHVIEIDAAKITVSKIIGSRVERFETDVHDIAVVLKSGYAWDLGLPVRWIEMHKEYSALWLECGPKRFRLLDGATDKEKRWIASEINAWLRLVR